MPTPPSSRTFGRLGGPYAVTAALLLALIGGCVTVRQGPHAATGSKSHERAVAGKLPDGASPRLYDVHLTLNPNQTRFTGIADIAVDLLEPDATLVLHGDKLTIESVEVQAGDGRAREVQCHAHADTATLHLQIEPPLPEGVSTVRFVYSAELSTDLAGIYRTISDGRAYIFSQFEPIAARRAFPCFDEPRFKAPFQLTLTVPEDSFAASNGAVVAERRQRAGQKTLVFQPTPPLPSYLVALAVGPLDVVESEIGVSPQRPYAVPVRGLATFGNASKLTGSLQHAGTVLQALESYVDLPYPFAKLDLAAVPDFAWGAMENAGLLTFRDWLLWTDDARSPYGQRRTALSVLAHELTHQWFGDWVTMPWWDDLWLNEAFATWRGQRTVHRLRPGMQFDLEQVESAGMAMHHDGLSSARRVREPCRNRDDIAAAADVVTYLKGAALLATFEHFVGAEPFREGVRAYLRRFPFASADSTTFLSTVAKASAQPGLAAAMQTFLDQPGVPEVNFSWRCEPGRAAVLHLSQERWRPLGQNLDAGLWAVPVCFRYGRSGHQQRHCIVLREPSHEMLLHGGCPEWFVANADGAGYYRSHVEDANAVALGRQKATPAETMAELDNAHAALRAGTGEPADVDAALVGGLQHDNPRIVVHALRLRDGIYRRYLRPAQQVTAQPHLRAVIQPLANKLAAEEKRLAAVLARRPPRGSATDAAADALGEVRLARKEVAHLAATTASDAAVRQRLAHLGALWLDGLESHADAAPVAALAALETKIGLAGEEVALALQLAGEDLGEPFVHRLMEALAQQDGGELRRRVVAALANVAEPHGAALVRQLALTGEVHGNEVLTLLAPQLEPGRLQGEAWAFVYKNLPALLARLPQRDGAALVGLGGWLCSAEARATFVAEVGPRISGIVGGERAYAQAIEGIDQCAAEVAAQGAEVARVLLRASGRGELGTL